MSYLLWNQVPYPGENKPPHNPVDPLAGSWPLFFLERGPGGSFRCPNGRPLKLNIKDPHTIDFNQQLKIVQKTMASLTKKQITIARYWGTGAATKQWTPIIDRLIDTYGATPAMAARILAAVQAGINDGFVVTWYLKYLYNVARPSQYDRHLFTVLPTPRFPAYPSGHSVISGCAASILSHFFPAESQRLADRAYENALSRLYAGVHFLIDNFEGLKLGWQIGRIAVNVLEEQKNSKGKPVDMPFTTFCHAEIPPPPYRQLIPFDFSLPCKSL